MQRLPPNYQSILEAHEAEVKAHFGDRFYDRIIEGEFSPMDFLELKRFLATLIQ
jgi:hypothetical protein